MAPQIVFMTGCSAGIGLALVQRLVRDADQRFIVIATVIAMSEKDDLEAAVKGEIGSKVFIKELDITKDENINEVVKDVIDTHGRIDVLLNIAGMAVCGIPEGVPRTLIDKMFAVNTIGTFRLTQAVLPHMKEKQSGKIITFSSIAGRVGSPYLEFYSASKFAVEGFFEGLAAGLRAFNIRVCLIEPRQTNTGLWAGMLNYVKADCDDETAFDIDRRQLRNRLTRWQAASPENATLTTDDIVDTVMTQCLDVDEPVFRHPLLGGVGDALKKTAPDLTGEEGLTHIGMKSVEDLE